VKLIVENNEGCSDTIISTVVVNEEYTFYAPNAISPKSTNTENTIFKVFGTGFDSNNFHLVIFDRWHNKVYETFDPTHGWDGRISGGELGMPDTYSWFVVYKDKNGLERTEKGHVSIIY
jgi:gliding motility-associated-like protein